MDCFASLAMTKHKGRIIDPALYFVNTVFTARPVNGSSQIAKQLIVFARSCPASSAIPTKQSEPLFCGKAALDL
jgi:hypothetical protein